MGFFEIRIEMRSRYSDADRPSIHPRSAAAPFFGDSNGNPRAGWYRRGVPRLLRHPVLLLVLVVGGLASAGEAAADSKRRLRLGSEPTSRNLQSVAARIQAGRCHLLLVGDSIATHVSLDGRGTWVTGIWRTWRPTQWRGRFIPTVLHGVSVNGTQVDDSGRSAAFDPACDLLAGNVRPGETIDSSLGSGWWGIPINAFETSGDLADRRLFRVSMPRMVDDRDFWSRYRTDPDWMNGPLRGTYLPILDSKSVGRYSLVGGDTVSIDVDVDMQRPDAGYTIGEMSIDFDSDLDQSEDASVALELRTDPDLTEETGASIAMLGAVIERRDRETGLLLGAHAVGGDTTRSHLDEGEWLSTGDDGFLRRYDDAYLVEFIERVEWNTFVITLGTNDLKSFFRTPEETAARLGAVIDRYRSAANLARKRNPEILEPRFLVISPATAEDPDLEPAFAGLDEAIGVLAGGDVAVVHLHRLLVDELGIGSSHQPEILVDPAHPDEVGAMLKAELVWKEIERSSSGTTTPAGPLFRVPHEFPTIAAATAVAGSDDVVLIAPGEHVGGGTISANDVVIRGSGGASECVLIRAEDGPLLEILSGAGRSVRIQGLTFSGGRAEAGAGVWSDACPLSIRESRFHDCIATGSGGAIRIGVGGVDLEDLLIDSSRAGLDGGGVAVEGGAFRGTRIEIRECEAVGRGGALSLDAVDATLSDCVFEDNEANEGGAIRVAGPISIQECVFERSRSLQDGGALLIDSSETSSILQSSFLDSVSGGSGGVCAARGGGSSQWRGVTARTGVADLEAGGWHVSCHDLSIATSSLEDLRADSCGVASVSCGSFSIESTVMCPDAIDLCGRVFDLGGIEYPAECDGVCEGDLNLDGARDGGDLGFLFAAWGQCPPASFCRADLDRDGRVSGEDLGRLLSLFGPPCGSP